MTRSPPRRPPLGARTLPGNILLGVALVARGRRDGLEQFGSSSQAFLASLAPLIAFPLVGAALLLLAGHPADALLELLATFCFLLVPPVLSYELARLWRRDAQWLRFATAFNWCYWLVPLLGMVLVLLLTAATAAGLPQTTGTVLLLVCLVAYGLWMHWFLARHGLQISGLRAALLVLAINLAVGILMLVPRLLGLGLGRG